jgi:hypothetical protein
MTNTDALQLAVNHLLACGHNVFCIDTSGDSIASQEVIASAGPGLPSLRISEVLWAGAMRATSLPMGTD